LVAVLNIEKTAIPGLPKFVTVDIPITRTKNICFNCIYSQNRFFKSTKVKKRLENIVSDS